MENDSISKQLNLFDQNKFLKYINEFLCPICNQQVKRSDYLAEIFSEKKVLEWFANLITHYRHNHISSWNKCWGRGGGYYRSGWFGDYEYQKSLVNERAKRQIIRKAYPILRELGLTVDHLKELQNTSDETIAVANKFLR